MSQPSEASSSLPSQPGGASLPGLRIAVVCATWHRELVQQAHEGLCGELQRLGVAARNIQRHEVPGAFEIPLLAQRLARSGGVDAIVACALVVDGGIYRHEFVAHAVIDALMRVQLDTGVPVFSAVLTPQAFHEHAEHQAFFATHLRRKGCEAAQACVTQLHALALLAQA